MLYVALVDCCPRTAQGVWGRGTSVPGFSPLVWNRRGRCTSAAALGLVLRLIANQIQHPSMSYDI